METASPWASKFFYILAASFYIARRFVIPFPQRCYTDTSITSRILKFNVLKTHSAVAELKGQRVCERHRLHFWHRQNVRCPSNFGKIKRSERCSDILYTSGARIPPLAHGNVIVTEMMAGQDSVWHRKCLSWAEFSMSLGEAWPFSDSLRVKFFPPQGKKKRHVCCFPSFNGCFIASSTAALIECWVGGGKFWPSSISPSSWANSFFSFHRNILTIQMH